MCWVAMTFGCDEQLVWLLVEEECTMYMYVGGSIIRILNGPHMPCMIHGMHLYFPLINPLKRIKCCVGFVENAQGCYAAVKNPCFCLIKTHVYGIQNEACVLNRLVLVKPFDFQYEFEW